MRERGSTDEQGGTEAASGVHADAGDVNAEDVNDDERDADDEAGKARGCAFLS